jgi:hypothetical protein
MSAIRSLIPELPPRAWTVLAGDACSAFGSGLVLPFLIVYLRDVRRISVDTAGLIVATVAVVSLAAGPAAGWLVDRVGSRRALLSSLVLSAFGSVAIAGIHSVPQAFAASALFGLGIVFLWPASHSLLMSVVTPAQRSSVLSVHLRNPECRLGNRRSIRRDRRRCEKPAIIRSPVPHRRAHLCCVRRTVAQVARYRRSGPPGDDPYGRARGLPTGATRPGLFTALWARRTSCGGGLCTARIRLPRVRNRPGRYRDENARIHFRRKHGGDRYRAAGDSQETGGRAANSCARPHVRPVGVRVAHHPRRRKRIGRPVRGRRIHGCNGGVRSG